MGLWTDTRQDGGAFRPRTHDPARLAALDQVAEWTRERFRLGARDAITVREATTELPGFPPRETHVVFWDATGVAHRFRVFKPVIEVVEEDLPPAWLRDGLVAGDFDCDCC